MKLTYPTLPWAITMQHWGNFNAKMYPAPTYKHMGIDIGGVNVGSPIYAVCDGFIAEVNLTGAHGYGRHVIIQHDGFRTLYAHLHKVFVSLGEKIISGILIGEMGGDPKDNDKIDGASTGTHLHFEVILPNPPLDEYIKTVLGYTVDPFAYLLNRYGDEPLYIARVTEPKGVRVRTQPSTAKTSTILYAFQKEQTMKVAEIQPADNDSWVRLWSLRPEWVAVTDNGKKLLELIPLHRTNPLPTQSVIDDKAIRLDEIDKMIEMLQERKKDLL